MTTSVTKYFIDRAHTDFDLVDERGRKIGIFTWALEMTTRWDPNLVWPNSAIRGGIVHTDPYVIVGSFVTRDGVAYGAVTKDATIGPVADPSTMDKTKAEIQRRISGARKRYAAKYGKEQQP